MGYVLLADALLLGAAAGVTQPMLDQATSLVNQYIERPEGLLVETNPNDGAPVCMAALQASITFSAGNIPAGSGVAVTVPDWVSICPGQALVIDRGTAQAEAVIVSSVSGHMATLKKVAYAHPSAQLQADVFITEQGKISAKGRFALRKSPMLRLLSVVGNEVLINNVQLNGSSVILGTGLTSSPHISASGMASVTYLAGYVTTPADVKQAVVRVANNIANIPVEPYISEKVDGISYQYSDRSPLVYGGALDNSAMQLLERYVQRF